MSICTFTVYAQNTSLRRVKEFWKRLFNATVYMKFRVCFTLANYENDMLSLCETTNVFIDVFFVIKKTIFIS